jgi:Virus neck protein
MATNVFFNNYDYINEQRLIDDLVIESIQMYGLDTFYLTRSLQAVDNILNEDDLSIFNAAYEMEVYVKSVDGFQGEGDFLSRFGLQIRDQAVFTVAIRTFERNVTNINPSILRPKEGDLIYFPLNNKFFKIMHVEHESVFYQSGALQVFDLKTELFEYSNERFNTGVIDIDTFFNSYKTTDISSLSGLKTRDPIANNIDFEEAGGDIIDFSEIDPFSEVITRPTNYLTTADTNKYTADDTQITADTI